MLQAGGPLGFCALSGLAWPGFVLGFKPPPGTESHAPPRVAKRSHQASPHRPPRVLQNVSHFTTIVTLVGARIGGPVFDRFAEECLSNTGYSVPLQTDPIFHQARPYPLAPDCAGAGSVACRRIVHANSIDETG